MTDPARIVVVGGGQAAGQLVASLRSAGFGGALVLVAAEPHLPYQRPPLSKAYLKGELPGQRLLLRPEAYYAKHDVELRLGTRATALDRARRSIRLADGEEIRYDKLALATGAEVKRLPVPGEDAEGVCYLRTVEDADRIHELARTAERVVVVGGGFIGLEAAATLHGMGKQVTVLEAHDQLMPRALAPVMAEWYRQLHVGKGVSVETGAPVTELAAERGRVRGVRCADGRRFPADLVVIGIGIAPAERLASEAGLDCDDGILVDEYARTSDGDIAAAGDCTRHVNALLGRRVRLESVQNAVGQARIAAATLAGKAEPYREVPWFWSDQYECKLQMAGLRRDGDRHVIRGDRASGAFSIFYFSDQVLTAVDSVNRPADHMLARKLLAGGVTLRPEQAADTALDLRSLL